MQVYILWRKGKYVGYFWRTNQYFINAADSKVIDILTKNI